MAAGDASSEPAEPDPRPPRYAGGLQTSLNTGGITLVSSSGDFAEWHGLLDEFSAGEQLFGTGF